MNLRLSRRRSRSLRSTSNAPKRIRETGCGSTAMDGHRANSDTRGEAVMFPGAKTTLMVMRRGQRRNQNAPRNIELDDEAREKAAANAQEAEKNSARCGVRLVAS